MTVHIPGDVALRCSLAISEFHDPLEAAGELKGGDFYMAEPNTLFMDDTIDNEIVGQLDKLVCTFVGDHRVLETWEKQHKRY